MMSGSHGSAASRSGRTLTRPHRKRGVRLTPVLKPQPPTSILMGWLPNKDGNAGSNDSSTRCERLVPPLRGPMSTLRQDSWFPIRFPVALLLMAGGFCPSCRSSASGCFPLGLTPSCRRPADPARSDLGLRDPRAAQGPPPRPALEASPSDRRTAVTCLSQDHVRG